MVDAEAVEAVLAAVEMTAVHSSFLSSYSAEASAVILAAEAAMDRITAAVTQAAAVNVSSFHPY